MKVPSVTIIVPVYNIEKWLPACIDSLIEQTYSDFRLVLVDDGSTDNSANICDEYAKRDTRIETVHQKNGGLSKARNTGIELAKGEFICFVDGDDFCEKEMLETAMKNFNENIDIVSFGFYRNSKKIATRKNKISNNFYDAVNLYITGELSVSACIKVYRNTVFKTLRFPEGKLFEDMWIFPKIAKNKILILNKALYHYVQRENSITTEKFKPEYMDFLKSLDNWKCDAKQLKIIRLRIAWNLLLFMENDCSNKNEVYAKQLAHILRTEKNFLIPVKGFINFILANLIACGFSYSLILSFRALLKRFKQFFPFR